MSEKKILIESESPVCPVQALVEQTDEAVYFYLFFYTKPENERIKFCWVCNRKLAPPVLDPNLMQAGKAPLMPAPYVLHKLSGIQLKPEALEIVWFEEGDGAALLENGSLLAVIPAWGGMKDFHGYAKYASGTGPFAWEMRQAEKTLLDRVNQARDFWAFLEQDDFWAQVQDYHSDVLEGFFGAHTQYYAIDNDKFPPRAIMEGEKDGIVYGCTLGVSLFRQPVIEMYDEAPEQHRRIEFGFAAEKACSDVKMQAYQCASALAGAMHEEQICLGFVHYNTWDGIEGIDAIQLVNTRELPQITDAPVYPPFRDDPVNLIWLVPVTKAEYDYLVENGADALLACAKDVSRLHIYDGQPKFELP